MTLDVFYFMRMRLAKNEKRVIVPNEPDRSGLPRSLLKGGMRRAGLRRKVRSNRRQPDHIFPFDQLRALLSNFAFLSVI